MSLTMKCTGCGATIQVPESAAGMRGKCRQCGATVHVPRAAMPPKVSPVQVFPKVRCSVCGGEFQYEHVYEIGGIIKCKACTITIRDSAKAKMPPALPTGVAAGTTLPTKQPKTQINSASELTQREEQTAKAIGTTIGHLIVAAPFLLGCLLPLSCLFSSDDHSGSSSPAVSESQRQHDKAEEMRDKGFNGSDSELAKTYDRIKDIEDAKRFRRERLGDN